LNEKTILVTNPPPRRRGYVAVAFAIVASAVYCLAFLVSLPSSWPAQVRDVVGLMSRPSHWIYDLVEVLLNLVSAEHASPLVHFTVYLLLVAGVLPWLIMTMLWRGRPYDLGLRRPNVYGWRITLVGYLTALPFLTWMVRGASFAGPYLGQLERAGGVAFSVYYLINMLTEHFLFHGVMLAALRVGHRWPPPAVVVADATSHVGRILQWVGLAQPTPDARGLQRVTQWLGLRAGCVPAIATSAMLFGLIHVGKDPRELWLSIPGGVALAYLAYRTNSWLTPFVLHIATAGTACAMIVWTN
jgi:hypothetical protein